MRNGVFRRKLLKNSFHIHAVTAHFHVLSLQAAVQDRLAADLASERLLGW